MQRKVLESLYNQGGLTLFAISDEDELPLEALQKFALALNAGARFVVIDFSGKHRFAGNTPFQAVDLSQRNLMVDDIDQIATSAENIFLAGKKAIPTSDTEFRTLYHNIRSLEKIAPQVIGIISTEQVEDVGKLVSIARLLMVHVTGRSVNSAAAFIEDVKEAQKTEILWLSKERPKRRAYPKARKAIRRNASATKEALAIDFEKQPEKLAKVIKKLHKVSILTKNPLDGFPRIIRNLFPLLLLAVIIAPFLFVTDIDRSDSNLRDRIQERNQLSVAPSFEYTFDGNENMQRIARYAIGRFDAIITNEKMIKNYVAKTLEENGFGVTSWEKGNLNIPPKGTTIRFSRPDEIKRPAAADTIGAAWKYWTSVISDSIAYLTEFYHETATSTQRKHNGIDVASRQGARILAPFGAKAWTSRDERGGVIIALVRKEDVILFMHCDKLLYLNGQEVMPGDPIATVGTTGHTTGPHAHIVTGLVSKKGKKRIGNVRYDVIDPIKWFYKFKPTSK
ncbi:M23 family metallopeptidase [Fibrobacter sp. UWB11]|uniref:M23 family metallopeptidase n=1 Tax=Fibrobacter sp. UWB11 TaxID=1896202 RepID=UPI00092ABCC1|nr:M23 family metallopeptidase [Fibrobacter sp. UWB11]SIN96609.1 Murein DD-endopeptidase MepM and murein hydrolase activator NlpD, contain LysM domain [Fibrobacter sp. UWB11]